MKSKIMVLILTLICSITQGSEMKNKKVLISGAGVAGLTLAYWLKQHGFVPTIVEQHNTLRTWGYKLDIRGSAIEVIKRMGIHEQAMQSSSDMQGATLIDSFGNEIPQMDPDVCGGRVKQDIEILRADLCNLLHKQVSDIEYLFGDCITSMTECDSGVYVSFEKEKPRLFDFVIGADGLHSEVRKLAFGQEELFLKDLGFYISYFSIPNYLRLDRWEIEYHGPQKFIIMYGNQPDCDAIAGFAFNAKPLSFDYRNIPEQKKVLQDAFCNVGWQAEHLLDLMDKSPNFFFDSAAQINMPSWSKGRVALLGDAAYAPSPVSGQGTSIAIVGAYVLAQELAKSDDIELAFKNYEEKMRPFVKRNQGLVDLSVALMTEQGSFISYLHRHMSEQTQIQWGQLVKEINVKRIHDAATCIALDD